MRKINDHLQKGLIIVLLIFIVSSMSSPAISGEIYKWKDKDGKTFFSDSPPPAGVATEVKTLKDDINLKIQPSVENPPPAQKRDDKGEAGPSPNELR